MVLDNESDNESQTSILPKHLFRSRFIWSCYEKSRHPLPFVVSVFCCLSGCLIYNLDITYRNVRITSIVYMILVLCSLYIPNIWFQFRRLRNMTEVAQQVSKMNPGFFIEKWESISSNSNKEFYDKGIWGTPYFFFDAQDARQMFRENVLKPYLKGKFNDDNINEIESSKLFLKSVRETFESSLKENLPELVSEPKYSREACKSRRSKVKRLALVLCFLFALQVHMLLYYTLELGLLLSIVGNLCYFLCVLLWSMLHVKPSMSILQGINFLSIITKVAPGKNLENWDEVAEYMNQYMADNGQSLYLGGINLGMFLDGKDCLECYKTFFEPLSFGNNRPDCSELIEIVKLTQPYVD